MSDLISIIIPVYNVENYLEECVQSVLGQTYKNIEVILVDDGSKDKSGDMCDKLQQIDSRIIVIHKDNGGLSSARNVGLAECSGNYVSFIDSDDIISEHYISDLYNCLINTNSDISMSGLLRFKDRVIFKDKTDKIVTLSSKKAASNILYQKKQDFFSVSACAKLYKKSLFNNVKYPEGKINEDLAVIVDLIMQCEKVSCIFNYNYFYRITDNSITTSSFSLKNLDVLEISKDIICKYDNNRILAKAAKNMFFRRNIEVLGKMITSKYNDQILKNKIIDDIKKLRFCILFDLNSKISSKVAAFISLFSINFLICFKNKKR